MRTAIEAALIGAGAGLSGTALGAVGAWAGQRWAIRGAAKVEHAQWSRDSRAETYVALMAHATRTYARIKASAHPDDEQRAANLARAERYELSGEDELALNARVRVYASEEVADLWQAYEWQVDLAFHGVRRAGREVGSVAVTDDFAAAMAVYKAHGDAEAMATAAYQALPARIRTELGVDRADGNGGAEG